jgi:hypothetical protein
VCGARARRLQLRLPRRWRDGAAGSSHAAGHRWVRRPEQPRRRTDAEPAVVTRRARRAAPLILLAMVVARRTPELLARLPGGDLEGYPVVVAETGEIRSP